MKKGSKMKGFFFLERRVRACVPVFSEERNKNRRDGGGFRGEDETGRRKRTKRMRVRDKRIKQ